MFPSSNLSQLQAQAQAAAQILLEQERQKQQKERNQILLAASLILQGAGSQTQQVTSSLLGRPQVPQALQQPNLAPLAPRPAPAQAPTPAPALALAAQIQAIVPAATAPAPNTAQQQPPAVSTSAPVPSSFAIDSRMQSLGYTNTAVAVAAPALRAVSPSSSSSSSAPSSNPDTTSTASNNCSSSSTTTANSSLFNMDFSSTAMNAGMTSMDRLSDEDYFGGAHRKTYLGERGAIIHVNSSNDPDATGGGAHKGEAFPMKLYRMLFEVEKEGQDDIVGYAASRRAFHIHKPEVFTKDIMPKYFSTTRMPSFQRQLNLYGFRRLSHGVDKGGYHNPFFIKGERNLCKTHIKRKISGGRAAASATTNSPVALPPPPPPQQLSHAPMASAAPALPLPFQCAATNPPTATAGSDGSNALAAALMPSLLALAKSELSKAQGGPSTNMSPGAATAAFLSSKPF